MGPLSSDIKEKRKSQKLSQEEFGFKAGAGIRFIREKLKNLKD